MSATDKAKNKAQEVAGKIKQLPGRARCDMGLEARGKSDAIKGDSKQAGLNGKDALTGWPSAGGRRSHSRPVPALDRRDRQSHIAGQRSPLSQREAAASRAFRLSREHREASRPIQRQDLLRRLGRRYQHRRRLEAQHEADPAGGRQVHTSVRSRWLDKTATELPSLPLGGQGPGDPPRRELRPDR